MFKPSNNSSSHLAENPKTSHWFMKSYLLWPLSTSLTSSSILPLFIPFQLVSRQPCCSLNLPSRFPLRLFVPAGPSARTDLPPMLIWLAASLHSDLCSNDTFPRKVFLTTLAKIELPITHWSLIGFIFLHGTYQYLMVCLLACLIICLPQLEYKFCEGKVFVLFNAIISASKMVPVT